jgi:hypothetical protein
MKSKYRKGSRIDDPMLVIRLIREGKPIYWRHKVQNAGWMQNQSIRWIEIDTRFGHFFFAHPILEFERSAA